MLGYVYAFTHTQFNERKVVNHIHKVFNLSFYFPNPEPHLRCDLYFVKVIQNPIPQFLCRQYEYNADYQPMLEVCILILEKQGQSDHPKIVTSSGLVTLYQLSPTWYPYSVQEFTYHHHHPNMIAEYALDLVNVIMYYCLRIYNQISLLAQFL